MKNERPEVVLTAAQAMGNLFIRLEQMTPKQNVKLNELFVAVI
jgi:hypothetical protein